MLFVYQPVFELKQSAMLNIKSQKKSNDYQNNDFSKKKQESDAKRLESMKRKRQEFKEKKMMIKTGLTGIVSMIGI